MKTQLIPVFFTLSVVMLFTAIFGFNDSTIKIKQDNNPMTVAEFNKRIARKDKMVLVYFHASWCTVCPKMKPVIEQLEKEYQSKIEVIRLDTDHDKDVAADFEIDALPVIVFYKNGVREWVTVGLVDKVTLKAKIDLY